jgi:hypothetical protein
LSTSVTEACRANALPSSVVISVLPAWIGEQIARQYPNKKFNAEIILNNMALG